MAVKPDIDTAVNTFKNLADTTNTILATIGDRAVINSFENALLTDLSEFQNIEIEAYYKDWEATPGGFVGGGARYHKTGTVTPASAGTGDAFSFFDVLGNEYSLAADQTITPLMIGCVGDGVADDTAFINLIEASSYDWIYLPEGYTFKTTLTSLTKTYFGPGLIDLNGTVTDYDFFGANKALAARSFVLSGDFTITSNSPRHIFIEEDATVDDGAWDIFVDGEQLKIRTLNDALSGLVDIVTFTRGGVSTFAQAATFPSLELRSNGGTPYIDFSNDLGVDFDARIVLTGDNTLDVQGVGDDGFLVNGNPITGGAETFNSSSAGNIQFESGAIIQWDNKPSPPTDSSATYSFPIAFPTACLTIAHNNGEGGHGVDSSAGIGIEIVSATQYTIKSGFPEGTVYWIAIGY